MCEQRDNATTTLGGWEVCTWGEAPGWDGANGARHGGQTAPHWTASTTRTNPLITLDAASTPEPQYNVLKTILASRY